MSLLVVFEFFAYLSQSLLSTPPKVVLFTLDILEKEVALIKILRNDCLFLNRAQIQRVLGRDVRRTNERLLKLYGDKVLDRKYRLDTFENFQSPVYFLGEKGAELTGMTIKDWKKFRDLVAYRKDRDIAHLIFLYDIYLKFWEETEILLWQPYTEGDYFFMMDVKPDAFIRYKKDGLVYECFIEADRNTESLPLLNKKLVRYQHFYENDFRIHFSGSGFRVLLVGISKRDVVRPSNQFVVQTLDEFTATFPEKLLERQEKYFPRPVVEKATTAVKKAAPPPNLPTIDETEFQKRFIKWSCGSFVGLWSAAAWIAGLDYVSTWSPVMKILLILGVILLLLYAKDL